MINKFRAKVSHLLLLLAQGLLPATREASGASMHLRKAIDAVRKIK